MTGRELSRIARLLLLLAVTLAASAGVHRLVTPALARLVRALATAGPDDLSLVVVLTGCCAAALALSWAWLVLCAAVAAAQALRAGGAPGHPARQPRRPLGTPRWVSTVVLVLLGAGVGASPALADAPAQPVAGPPAARTPGLAGLAVPDRTRTPAAQRTTAVRTVRVLRVRAGDTLWSLAQRELPAGAGEAAIDRAWRRMAAANCDRVADPDLIFPGTVLRVPHLDSSTRKEPS